jgi:hypothetical protein
MSASTRKVQIFNEYYDYGDDLRIQTVPLLQLKYIMLKIFETLYFVCFPISYETQKNPLLLKWISFLPQMRNPIGFLKRDNLNH